MPLVSLSKGTLGGWQGHKSSLARLPLEGKEDMGRWGEPLPADSPPRRAGVASPPSWPGAGAGAGPSGLALSGREREDGSHRPGKETQSGPSSGPRGCFGSFPGQMLGGQLPQDGEEQNVDWGHQDGVRGRQGARNSAPGLSWWGILHGLSLRKPRGKDFLVTWEAAVPKTPLPR